jgi:hypothetical protein
MARKHEAVSWLNQGLSPSGIAQQMGVTIATVMGYLYNQVGEGKIPRSDILFAIGQETRQAVDAIEREHGRLDEWQFRRALNNEHPGVDADDACVYRSLKAPLVYLGDMYAWMYLLEWFLHGYIKETLIQVYGNEWWRKGIPDSIRADCAATLERDSEPAAEPYCYTTLVQLKETFEKRWDLFSRRLPVGPASDRKRFLSGLTRINQIRNRVMHASKGVVPNEDDFRFLREFLNFADVLHWNEDLGTREQETEAAAQDASPT